MRRTLTALVFALPPLLGAAAGACGGSSSGGNVPGAGGAAGAAPNPADVAALCDASVVGLCTEEATCTPKDFRYPSLDACVAAMKSFCSTTSAMTTVFGANPSFNDGSLDIDWNAFTDCAKKKAALGPSCRPPPAVTAADVLTVRDACDPRKLVRPGTRAAGAPCYVELQCQPGLICSSQRDRSDGGLCGSCQPLAEGASCAGQADCGATLGFSCDPKTNTCIRNAHAGEACDARPCEPTEFLGCDAATKRCAPLARSGESCATIGCDTGLFVYCSRLDQTCKPLPRNPGDSCKPDGVCGAGLGCETTSYTCQPLGGLGASCASVPCDPSQGVACAGAPPACVSAYAHPGDKCGLVGAANVECWQSACETDSGATGTCVPYGLDGAPCKSSTTCAEFYECANGACQSEVSLIGDSAAYADALAEINACM